MKTTEAGWVRMSWDWDCPYCNKMNEETDEMPEELDTVFCIHCGEEVELKR